MMHSFQQIVTEAERCYNFVVHGLPPRGGEMGVSPLIWRKKLMDSISGNLGYNNIFQISARFPDCVVLMQRPGIFGTASCWRLLLVCCSPRWSCHSPQHYPSGALPRGRS